MVDSMSIIKIGKTKFFSRFLLCLKKAIDNKANWNHVLVITLFFNPFYNIQLLSLAINKLIQFKIIAAKYSTGRLTKKIAFVIIYIIV